jgi:hypothetical protein
MASFPAIVVVGFDRPRSIQRLLTWLTLARYPQGDIPLVISLDYSPSDNGLETRQIAEQYEWPHGPKRIILQPEFLGLRNHVLRCGDLSKTYGSIIVLEDDLSVSREFYHYAVAALDFTRNLDTVAGVALYSHRLNATANLPFEPLYDGADNFYLQIAASWGQAWTAAQWSAFRGWYEDLEKRDGEPLRQIPAEAPIPRNIANWSEFSWLKYFIWYLAETGRVFFYPRISYSTNHADRGTHSPISSKAWHVPLALRSNDYRFFTPDESLAVYDAFFEVWPDRLKQLYPLLDGYDFDVDLYGTKQRSLLNRQFVLTSRRVSGRARLSFDIERKPLEANFSVASDQKNVHSFSLIESRQIREESSMLISNLETVRYFFNIVPIRDIVKNSLRYLRQRRKQGKF